MRTEVLQNGNVLLNSHLADGINNLATGQNTSMP